MSTASHDAGRSVWICPARSSPGRRGAGHSCGPSTTPSRVIEVELMILPMAPSLSWIGAPDEIRSLARREDQFAGGAGGSRRDRLPPLPRRRDPRAARAEDLYGPKLSGTGET